MAILGSFSNLKKHKNIRACFSCKVINAWNKLPEKIVISSSLDLFKRNCYKFTGFIAAQRRGESIETFRRRTAGQNKQRTLDINISKLEEDTEEFHNDRVEREVGKIIMQARQAKSLTQKELANLIQEKPQVISEIEQGQAIKKQDILNKLQRVLGVRLQGKDKGKPLGGPKKN